MKVYRSTFGLLVLGCLTAPFAANAQFGTEPAKLSLVKVRDDVYVIRNPFVPGNTTAVITGEGVILASRPASEQDAAIRRGRIGRICHDGTHSTRHAVRDRAELWRALVTRLRQSDGRGARRDPFAGRCDGRPDDLYASR